MFIRTHMFSRVTIVGVGLMGGSLGLAIKKNNLAREVVGLSHKHSSLTAAVKANAIDVALTEPAKALQDAELVILATPVHTIISLLPTIAKYVRRGAFITDVGSTKAEIIDAVQKYLPAPTFYVGSHPLAGSEKKGAEFARADLFENSTCIMTPIDSTNQVAKEKVRLLWTKIGATVKFMTPEEHDEVLAYVSHLPHVLAYSLMDTIIPKSMEFSAQGLKDTTRIASSSPQMWNDICLSNSQKLIKALDELVKNLSLVRKSIATRDQKTLTEMFTRAKEKRDALQPK